MREKSPSQRRPSSRPPGDGSFGAGTWGPISLALVRVAHMHRRLAGELLRQVGLHPGQELLLMLLWDQDHRPQSELVEALGVEAPTITKMLQRLEQQEIVTRQRPPANRRTVVVSLTATGRKLHQDVQRIWTELEESTTRSLTAADKRTLARMFEHLERDLAAAQGGIPDPDLLEWSPSTSPPKATPST